MRAFIICFYARSPEEGPANTWTAQCHPADRTIGNGMKAGKEAERSREEEGEEGGHELSGRNNISPEDLFTWRETLPLVFRSGSLPWESFVVVDVKSINLLR